MLNHCKDDFMRKSKDYQNHISWKWIEFDVTNDIKAFLNGAPNYGWIIMKNDEDSSGRINIEARESISNIPQLELLFT